MNKLIPMPNRTCSSYQEIPACFSRFVFGYFPPCCDVISSYITAVLCFYLLFFIHRKRPVGQISARYVRVIFFLRILIKIFGNVYYPYLRNFFNTFNFLAFYLILFYDQLIFLRVYFFAISFQDNKFCWLLNTKQIFSNQLYEFVQLFI